MAKNQKITSLSQLEAQFRDAIAAAVGAGDSQKARELKGKLDALLTDVDSARKSLSAFDKNNPVIEREHPDFDRETYNPEASPRKRTFPAGFNPEATPRETTPFVREPSAAAPKGKGGGKSIGKMFKGPLRTVGIAAAGLTALPLVEGAVEGVKETVGQDGRMREYAELRRRMMMGEMAERRRAQDMRAKVEENTALLARYAPELLQQVMAGRKLPRSATVIGGKPRTDLVEQLAGAMSTGAFDGAMDEMGGGLDGFLGG